MDSKDILPVEDPKILQTLIGPDDKNLKAITDKLDIVVSRVSKGLEISGPKEDVSLAQDLLKQLKNLIESGENIFSGDVERALKLLSSDRKLKLKNLYRDQIKISGRKHSIVPKTPTQGAYLEAIKDNDLVFGIGPAGTGKTYLAMAMAVQALLKKEVKRIVLCRPAVEAGERLGFLPGDMAEKVNPYLRPLYDALHDMLDFDKTADMLEKGQIEVAPLAFMRGRTLANAFVILDEAQNTSKGQMKMFLTRLGPGSKCVITGDTTQIDLQAGVESGLVEALNILNNVSGISQIQFSERDVIRHHLVAKIVKAYDGNID